MWTVFSMHFFRIPYYNRFAECWNCGSAKSRCRIFTSAVHYLKRFVNVPRSPPPATFFTPHNNNNNIEYLSLVSKCVNIVFLLQRIPSA